MKEPTPEQSIRAAVTVVMMHALLNRCAQTVALNHSAAEDNDCDEDLVNRAITLADKVIAKVFP